MKNQNDLILERLRGIPPSPPDWRAEFDPQNPNVLNTNDNEAVSVGDQGEGEE